MQSEKVIQENIAEKIRDNLERNNIKVIQRQFWKDLDIDECIC